MYTSKFKLALHWLLFTAGFYIFWLLSYLILAKFAISQFSRFQHTKEGIWSQLMAADLFWYAMFVFGMAIAIYVIRLFIKYAPNRKIAAVIYALLIILSVVVLMDKLLETTTGYYILPHVLINIVFLVPIVYSCFKRNEETEETDVQGEDTDQE
jgi:hypothetical protein